MPGMQGASGMPGGSMTAMPQSSPWSGWPMFGFGNFGYPSQQSASNTPQPPQQQQQQQQAVPGAQQISIPSMRDPPPLPMPAAPQPNMGPQINPNIAPGWLGTLGPQSGGWLNQIFGFGG